MGSIVQLGHTIGYVIAGVFAFLGLVWLGLKAINAGKDRPPR
jgi:hypothetical protein